MRPGRRQDRVERGARFVGKLRQFDPVVLGGVGGQRPGPGAIRHDGEAIAARQPAVGQRFSRREKVADLRDADRTDPPQCRVEHRIVADERTGMAHHDARARRVAAGFQNDHRLDACGDPDAGHQRPRVMDAFEVEQYRACRAIPGQEIQNFRDRDVRFGAGGDDRGKAKARGPRVIQQRRRDRARLRNERHCSRPSHGPGPTGIEPDVGPHQPETVGAEHTHLGGARPRDHFAFECAALRPLFAQARRQHQHGRDALFAGLVDDVPAHVARRSQRSRGRPWWGAPRARADRGGLRSCDGAD